MSNVLHSVTLSLSRYAKETDLGEGLSSVKYTVLQHSEFALYTWLYVDLNGQSHSPTHHYYHVDMTRDHSVYSIALCT